MQSRNTFLIFSLMAVFAYSTVATAQSGQYKRKAPAVKKDAKGQPVKKAKGDKLDISDLEQKYWAPKDTDFSVVQNRTYTKANKFAANLLYGPFVNETFSEGKNLGLGVNYYFSERHGVEFMFASSDTGDSKTTKVFRDNLSGGGVGPDYNRPTQMMSLSYNWVPFYAKMSVLGKRIIYFDMQFSPGIAMSTYEQMTDLNSDRNPEAEKKTAVGLSFDVTQFFFLSKHIAVRADLRNRWYKQDIVNYTNGSKQRSETTNTSMFLLGVTYFF